MKNLDSIELFWGQTIALIGKVQHVAFDLTSQGNRLTGTVGCEYPFNRSHIWANHLEFCRLDYFSPAQISYDNTTWPDCFFGVAKADGFGYDFVVEVGDSQFENLGVEVGFKLDFHGQHKSTIWVFNNLVVDNQTATLPLPLRIRPLQLRKIAFDQELGEVVALDGDFQLPRHRHSTLRIVLYPFLVVL